LRDLAIGGIAAPEFVFHRRREHGARTVHRDEARARRALRADPAMLGQLATRPQRRNCSHCKDTRVIRTFGPAARYTRPRLAAVSNDYSNASPVARLPCVPGCA
jgi:hypothetical protein